ncbi:MAG TPA: hypothetical protein VMY41_08835 [Thermohalobaculum sp.]|nr:hypothetical protein [Thermohalobaculum sp.]
MEDNTIINGLLKLRTETAQQVGYARARLAELSHDLEAIEHVLTAMGHYERPPTPLAYAGQFSRGERRLFIMELLGKRGPLKSGDIAKEFLTRKGLNPDDPTLFRRQQQAVSTTLNQMKHRGVVAQAGRGRDGRVWQLAQ